MKEKYVKPAMVIERFELTSAIAKNCGEFGLGGLPTQSEPANCAWEIAPGFTLFFDGQWQCSFPVIDGEDAGFGIICYNNPGGNATIFSS